MPPAIDARYSHPDQMSYPARSFYVTRKSTMRHDPPPEGAGSSSSDYSRVTLVRYAETKQRQSYGVLGSGNMRNSET